MKTKIGIKRKIVQIEKGLQRQIAFAELHKGDGHDKSRKKAILIRQGYLSGLKWVLK